MVDMNSPPRRNSEHGSNLEPGSATVRWSLRVAIAICVLAMSNQTRAWQPASAPAAGASEAETTAPATPALTSDTVTARAEDAADSADLTEDEKKAVAVDYRLALEQLELAKNAAEQNSLFQSRTDRDRLAKSVAELEAQLARFKNTESELVELEDLPAYEQALAAKNAEIAQLKQPQISADAEATRRVTRRKELHDQLPVLEAELQEVTKELDADAPDGEKPPQTQASSSRLLTRQATVQRQVPTIEQELAAYDAEETVDLVRLQREMAAARVAFAQEERRLLDDKVKALVEKATDDAFRKAQEELINSHPLLKPLAERNRALAEEASNLTSKIETIDLSFEETQALAESVGRSYTQATEKVEQIGQTDAIGFLLRKERARLPDTSIYRQRLEEHSQLLGDAHFLLLSYDDELETADDPAAIVARILAEADPTELTSDSIQTAELEAAVVTILERKHEYLRTLVRSYNRYFERLLSLVATERRLLKSVDEFSSFIDERVLWIRSNGVLRANDVLDSPDAGLNTLVSRQSWSKVITASRRDAVRHPGLYIAAVFVLVVLIRFERRIEQEIRDIGELAMRKSCTDAALTLRALMLTFLQAAFWPGLVAATGWRLCASTEEANFAFRLGTALLTMSQILLPLELLRHGCRSSGLAEVHMNWPASSCNRIRRNLRWVSAVLVPLLLVALVLPSDDSRHALSGIARVLFIVGSLVLAVFLRRLLKPTGGVLQEYIAYHQNEWVHRFQKLWYLPCLAAPIALAVLSFSGFDFTARHLAWKLLSTVWLILGLIAANGLLVRLLLIQRRKLSFEQARERRAAALAAQQTKATPESAETVKPAALLPPLDETTDLAKVSVQSRQIVTAAIATIFALGAWYIWADVLPALRTFDSWTVWELEVSEVSDAGDPIVKKVPVTLSNLVLAGLLAVLFVIAARNVPGLMEITLLERLPIDRSTRYAVKMLASYFIVLVGIIAVFGTMGIGWSRVQWLATALTFGLAFGLQEVFANFVAGVIILFERPLRVGDVVTIDDVTGVVSQIRIRATTITNWDRKEFVVPNKEFITGKLLNWTLSDQTNRIVIATGVAYGSDTNQVQQLILDVAVKHPLIMKDPSPSVAFDAFGDSALNFTLRAYLPDMDNRLSTTHALHTAIYETLNEHNIEIAFPQQDIHIRSMPESLTPKNDS
jgi:potassium efflux system protein